jgi:hypothetical protein
MASLTDALTAINELKERGLIADYAIGGAMAHIFWAEAITTFDLDVLVRLASPSGLLVGLGPIYAWAAERQFPLESDHIVIGEVPVQFLEAFNALAEEAVRDAKTLDYSGLPIRVVGPEHLIALSLDGSAATAKRKLRAAMLRESPGVVDEDVLQDILTRYNLTW